MATFKSFDVYDQTSAKTTGTKLINIDQIVEFFNNGNKTTRVKLSNGDWFDINISYENIEHYVTGLKPYKW